MDTCIFCKIIKGDVPSWKVYENEKVYAFLDIHPVNQFHTLVIPKVHYNNSFDTPVEDLKEIISVIKKLITLYKEKLGIDNIQIVNSNGWLAQQDVFHTHYHIVPRFEGDNQNIVWNQERWSDEALDKTLLIIKELSEE